MTAADLAAAAAEDAELALVLAAWEADAEDAASLLAGLEPSDLTHPAAAEGLRAIQSCLTLGERPSRLAVRRHMVGHPDLYSHLAAEDAARGGVVTGAEARAAREEVRLSAARLRARRAVRALEAELDAPGLDLPAWRARAGQVLGQIGPGGDRRAMVTMPSVLGELAERYRQGRQREGYVATGLRRLDALTGGLGPGQLILLGGRPGEGKSALGLQVAAHASRAHGPVLLITLEMSAMEVATRLVQQHQQIGHDEVTAERIERVRGEYPRLYVADTGASLEEIQGLADTFRRQHPDAALVVLDYLGLVRPRGNQGSSYERISLVARELKILAQRLELPLLALVQLRRPQRGGDDPPALTDLRDSGELEQAANKVILLHRRPGTVTDGEAPRTVVALLAKNREGATGSIELHWQPATLSMHGIEPREPMHPGPAYEEMFL